MLWIAGFVAGREHRVATEKIRVGWRLDSREINQMDSAAGHVVRPAFGDIELRAFAEVGDRDPSQVAAKRIVRDVRFAEAHLEEIATIVAARIQHWIVIPQKIDRKTTVHSEVC